MKLLFFPHFLRCVAPLLAVCAMTVTVQAQTILYRQTFGNNLGGTSASVNWRYLSGTGATDASGSAVFGGNSVPGTNLPNVNTSVNSSVSAGHWGPAISTIGLVMPNATEQAAFASVDLNPVDYSSLTFSWYSGVSNALTSQRLVLQIGGNWYATDASYTNVITTTFAAQAVQYSVTFAPTAAMWRDLTVTPGTALTLAGSARSLNLPAGAIQNFGILSEGNGTSRVDTFQVAGVAVPEPSVVGLAGVGVTGLMVGRRRRKRNG